MPMATLQLQAGNTNASSPQYPAWTRNPKWRSIIIIAACFAQVFTCCGLNFAFGVYQALFQKLSSQPGTPFTGASTAAIDLIGTLSISLMTIGAPFVVAWSKRFSPGAVSFVGGFIFALALVLASFGTKLWHFELTQGLLLGVGTCMSYMPAVTVAPAWFTNNRGLALGIILSGTGVGGLVWAPALNACINSFGFRNTLRLTGGLSFALVSIASYAIIWEPTAKAQNDALMATKSSRLDGILKVPLVDWRIAKSRKFVAQALGAIFQSAAYFTPVFFFASYARTLGYSEAAGANFIAISNACNALGKIAIGYAADRTGRLNALLLTTFLSSVTAIGLWYPSTLGDGDPQSRQLFIAFTVLYGIFASAYVSLFPASLVELFGAQNFASVNGILYMMRGMATLVGTPIGGLLIRGPVDGHSPGSYSNMALLVSSLLFAGTIAVFWVRIEAIADMDRHGKRRWRQ